MTRALVCSLALAFLTMGSSGFADRRPLSVEDIFELELATEPQISPDGKQVVYVRRFVDVMADQRRSNLWIVDADGNGEKPLTTGSFADASPRWSPDGTSLLYVSDREGSPQIYRRWMDTGLTAKLTDVANPPSGIAWSPDGKWISFIALETLAPQTIRGMPVAPPGAAWAPAATVTDRLTYRFNGAGYLKPGYMHVFVVPSTGGTPRRITKGNFNHGAVAPGAARNGDPAWTRDGEHILVSVNRRADADLESLDTEVVRYSVADGADVALTDRRGPDDAPAVSPDGKHVAYLGFDDRYQGYQPTQLYVMKADGTGTRLLTAELDRDVANIRWARDSRSIYFTADEGGETGIYSSALTGGAPRRLASSVGSTFNALGGGASISVAKEVIATTTNGPHRPGDIAVVNARGGNVRALTDVNADLFAARALGAVDEIRYASSKDGRDIQGWIVKPPDFDPARKYPLVLEIHGGPFANYGPRFDIEKQLLAAQGYMVLYTNPRGSTSYGEEFGNLIHHAYPGDDLYDLLSGVDAAIERGNVDANALFVTGGSGGGVLTCWVIGHTDRFRAAATLYPVINWSSFVLTADVGSFAGRYWFPGPPWEHSEHYWQRSLLSVVKNVKTPTLVMVGDEDYRTPVSESEQYYQALKMTGVESELVRVPGEPHGITRRPSHHVAKVLAIIDWFERHLGTPAPLTEAAHSAPQPSR